MLHSSLRLEAVVVFFYTLSSAIGQSQEWPVGTLATASTTHPPLAGAAEGQFKPNNAIDNDATTKWNDDTMEGESTRPYPDIFTLIIGSEVNLDGIILLSGSDGWILDYTVETSQDGVSWNLSATIKRSSVVLRFIRFDNGPLLKVKQLRVIITAAMAGYSRISELSPVYAVSNSTTNPPSPSTAATTTTTTTTTPPPTPSPVTSRTRSNTVGVIAGVLGGLAGILLGLLAYFLWLLRKQRKQRNGDTIGTGVEGAGQAVAVGDPQKSPVSGFSFNTNVASELGGQHPESFGGYPRTELA